VVVFVGLLFWAIVGVIIYVAYLQVVSARAS
jgi:hypothetical protein